MIASNLLDSLERSYFITRSLISSSAKTKPMDEDKKVRLYQAHQDAVNHYLNNNNSYPFTQLYMIKVLHFESGDYLVLPWILENSSGYIKEKTNPKFNIWHIEYKKLMFDLQISQGFISMTYNYTLPDGQILEYIVDNTLDFKISDNQKIYQDAFNVINNTLLKQKIENKLQTNNIHDKPKAKL